MYIKYINKGTVDIVNCNDRFTFKEGEVKEVPQHVGNYLVIKKRAEFVIASEPTKPEVQKIVLEIKNVTPEIKKVIEEQKPDEVIAFEKKPESTKFIKANKIKKAYKGKE